LTYAALLLLASALDTHAVGDDFTGSFLKQHCVDCHAGEKPEAGLRLDKLAIRFDEPQQLATWIRIHDRVARRQMPPQEAEQPSDADRAKFAGELDRQLHAASLAKQQREGRVIVRRLNRTEYENTLHDLLNITSDLKSLLPDDPSVGGFDNVSSGLETSATHLVRYQDAAERALNDAVPYAPASPMKIRMTGREYLASRQPVHLPGIAPYSRLAGDTFILHAAIYKHGCMQTPGVVWPGQYRFRASVRTVQSDKPLPVLCGRISSDRFDHEKLLHIFAVHDAPVDQSRVIEFETPLPIGERIYVEAWNALPTMPDYKKKFPSPPPDDFAEPGLAIDWIELEGPLDFDAGGKLLFGDLERVPHRFVADTLAGKKVYDWAKMNPNEFRKPENRLRLMSNDPKADAERLLRGFIAKAFRRPVVAEIVDSYIKSAHAMLDRGEPLDEALLATYKAVLCSPHFLLLIEKPGVLDDYALAARLSYFLWSSLPDEELLSLAAEGKLTGRGVDDGTKQSERGGERVSEGSAGKTPGQNPLPLSPSPSRPLQNSVLRAQVERMLKDPRARRFTAHFTGQWLELRKTHDMKPDSIYSEFDDKLAWSMPEETRRFFDEVLRDNLPTTSFLHSDWSMLNARLAQHYGIGDVTGLDFRRVTLPADSHRGGVVTHASVLKLTTNATYTSPVKRGAWLLERILGTPPNPPPPNVAAIEPDIRGAVTIREQLAKHQSVAVCASCHKHIDPPGFALESFDVLGGWREFYRSKHAPPGGKYVDLVNYPGRKVWLGKPVEAFGKSAAGDEFATIDDYKRLLLRDPDQITRNLAEKLLIYGTGGTIQYADRAEIEQIVARVRDKNHGFRELIHEVVSSRVFQSK